MTLTINLPEDILATLNERARMEGRPVAELATEAVMDRYGPYEEEEFPLDADSVEKIRRGFVDMDAGRTISLEEARADLKAAFATRYGSVGA